MRSNNNFRFYILKKIAINLNGNKLIIFLNIFNIKK
jgi:hypothetical protein